MPCDHSIDQPKVYKYRPSFVSFNTYWNILLILNVMVTSLLITLSMVLTKNIDNPSLIAILFLSVVMIAEVVVYFVNYSIMDITIHGNVIIQNSLLGRRTLDLTSLQRKVFYRYGYTHIPFCDRIINSWYGRDVLRLNDNKNSIYISDNVEGFADLLYHINSINKMPAEERKVYGQFVPFVF
jgi:hypothetical protein